LIVFRAEQSQRDKQKLEQAEEKIAALQKARQSFKSELEELSAKHELEKKEM